MLFPTHATTPSPTQAPTPFPTTTPALPPVNVPQDLIDLFLIYSFDSGDALHTPSTPQYKALNWLTGNVNFDTYNDEHKIQCYALATLYFSTSGETWGLDLWVTDANECEWGNAIGCISGAVSKLEQNVMLKGTIPIEIGMLSNLGE